MINTKFGVHFFYTSKKKKKFIVYFFFENDMVYLLRMKRASDIVMIFIISIQ